MFGKPQDEHRWLEQLVGAWNVESVCRAGPPDQPEQKSHGRGVARSVGGLWMILETEGESPEGEPWTTVMTLGYDPALGRFVGTFIGSMMNMMWVYSGALDADRRRLVLDATGPKMDRSGTTQYQDIFEKVDDNHWILSSQILTDDGTWQHFMSADHRRTN